VGSLAAGWTGTFLVGIVVLATVAVAVSIERGRQLFRSPRPPSEADSRRRAEAVAELLNHGQLANAVSGAAADGEGPAALVRVGVAHWPEGADSFEPALEEVAAREIGRLERGVWLLAVVANVAALLGYFGAIAGMLDAFSLLSDEGLDKPDLLAALIGRAVAATFAGLAVAGVALVAYSVFTTRIAARVRQLETWARVLFSAHDARPRELTPPAAGW